MTELKTHLMKRRNKQQNNLRRALHRIRNLQLSLAWAAMLEAALGGKRRIQALIRVMTSISHEKMYMSLLHAFQRLRDQSLQTRAVYVMLMRWRERSLATCWGGWMRYVQTSRGEQEEVKRMALVIMNRRHLRAPHTAPIDLLSVILSASPRVQQYLTPHDMPESEGARIRHEAKSEDLGTRDRGLPPRGPVVEINRNIDQVFTSGVRNPPRHLS